MRGRAHIERNVGHGTGMDAEWLALKSALRLAQELETEDFVLLGDCAAVINQANGTVKVRGTNRRHLNDFHIILANASLPRIRYIKRSQNLAGIALARLHP